MADSERMGLGNNPDGIKMVEAKVRRIKTEILGLQNDLMETFDTGERFDAVIARLDLLDREGTILQFRLDKRNEVKQNGKEK